MVKKLKSVLGAVLIFALIILTFYKCNEAIPTTRYTVRLHYLDGYSEVIYWDTKLDYPTVTYNRHTGYEACGRKAVCRIDILKKEKLKND